MSSSMEIRRRIRLFASLQAAHRALAREAHPSALGPLRKESRDLLVRLQKLSNWAEGGGEVADPPEVAAELESVDRVLEGQTTRTLAILDSIEFAQLRALAPTLVQRNPEELKGLLDVLLEGDLEDDKSLRTLEYLITLLSTEERNGRRQALRDPAALTERLRERTAEWSPRTDVLVAERALDSAAERIVQGADLGEVRDRVRLYKEGLGPDLLHPPVLAAVVRYNAAMSNQIAAELEGIRSLEDLAIGLYDETSLEERMAHVVGARGGEEFLRGSAFTSIVAAFGARIHGDELDDGPARQVVERLDLENFDLEDLEAFDAAEGAENGWLVRSTVVLGSLLKNLDVVADSLRDLDIDPDLLGSACSDLLRESMNAMARKNFADSNYGEAFRLSELKRRNLGTARSEDPAPATPARRTAPAPSGRKQTLSLDLGILPGQASWVARAAAVLLALFLLPSLGERLSGEQAVPEAAVREVSPFLDSGTVLDLGGHRRRFVGNLGPTWAWLGTPERREVTTSIGEAFRAEGVSEVVLMDRPGHTAAEFADGAIVAVTPRSAGDATPTP
jgi:hypothetical protein